MVKREYRKDPEPKRAWFDRTPYPSRPIPWSGGSMGPGGWQPRPQPAYLPILGPLPGVVPAIGGGPVEGSAWPDGKYWVFEVSGGRLVYSRWVCVGLVNVAGGPKGAMAGTLVWEVTPAEVGRRKPVGTDPVVTPNGWASLRAAFWFYEVPVEGMSSTIWERTPTWYVTVWYRAC